ncbi:hypothetical protein [Neptunicella sp. SCSIO 80796]|uniref:beta-xylosidase family glycoside hydrolase n=1 Tax=Neptunicella plasticusilytica TaxID=3117012 RepID=UPI003A4D4C88
MSDSLPTKGASVKLVIVLAITLVLILVIWLSFDWLRTGTSNCESIFQQSETQFSVKLSHLDTEGEVVLGRQQIQDLTEKAQITALNLKACCLVHDTGAIDTAGFAQCRQGGQEFAARLTELEGKVKAIVQARQRGDGEQEQQLKTEVDQLVSRAEAIADNFDRQLNQLPRAALRKNGEVFFFDDFDQPELNPDWQILQPDPNRWALQSAESSLLIVTQKGHMAGKENSLRNQFILSHNVPDENFVMETRVSLPIQHQKNGVSMGLWQDADNFLQIGYFGFPHGYNVARQPYFNKELEGQANQQKVDIDRIGGVKKAESIYLRIERTGNKYIGSFALPNDSDQPEQPLKWRTIATHAVPKFSGRPAIWADNQDGKVYSLNTSISPEVPAEFDYLSIRPVE